MSTPDPATTDWVPLGGLAPAVLPGYEYAYTEFTSTVSVTATTEAGATTIVTAPAVTLDGSTIVMVEFFSPAVAPAAGAGNFVQMVLFDGTSIGIAGTVSPSSGSIPVVIRRRLTPSAGAHTYSMRGYVNAGTATAVGGIGGGGAALPGFIRVTKV
jgi:hypothetical protein